MVDRNSAPEEFACIWQSKWVGIITIETEKMWIHFSCDVFVAVSCRCILNTLIFTKAWSLLAWIPVVSSSLYFWKSVFSFRVDSILQWRVYIINWKFPDCVHFFNAWARQAVIESIGTFKIQRRGRQRERQKSNRFYKQNNNFVRALRFFVHYLDLFCTTTTWKCITSRFMEYVRK